MYYIYKRKNLLDGSIYIGQTCQEPETRWHQEDYSTQAIGFAVRQAGIHNFKNEIIEIVSSAEEANSRGKYWIKYYNSTVKGYNRTKGGGNSEKRNTYFLNTYKNIIEQCASDIKWINYLLTTRNNIAIKVYLFLLSKIKDNEPYIFTYRDIVIEALGYKAITESSIKSAGCVLRSLQREGIISYDENYELCIGKKENIYYRISMTLLHVATCEAELDNHIYCKN